MASHVVGRDMYPFSDGALIYIVLVIYDPYDNLPIIACMYRKDKLMTHHQTLIGHGVGLRDIGLELVGGMLYFDVFMFYTNVNTKNGYY